MALKNTKQSVLSMKWRHHPPDLSHELNTEPLPCASSLKHFILSSLSSSLEFTKCVIVNGIVGHFFNLLSSD